MPSFSVNTFSFLEQLHIHLSEGKYCNSTRLCEEYVDSNLTCLPVDVLILRKKRDSCSLNICQLLDRRFTCIVQYVYPHQGGMGNLTHEV